MDNPINYWYQKYLAEKNKKDQVRLDKQLDQIADNLLMEAYRETFSIVDGIYARLLVKLRDKIEQDYRKRRKDMARVVIEINGERHILTKDRGAFECEDCSLVAYCYQIDGMCVQLADASGYHFVKDKKQ